MLSLCHCFRMCLLVLPVWRSLGRPLRPLSWFRRHLGVGHLVWRTVTGWRWSLCDAAIVCGLRISGSEFLSVALFLPFSLSPFVSYTLFFLSLTDLADAFIQSLSSLHTHNPPPSIHLISISFIAIILYRDCLPSWVRATQLCLCLYFVSICLWNICGYICSGFLGLSWPLLLGLLVQPPFNGGETERGERQ